MECMKEFMQESYQARLRMFAQSKSERYEDTIESYKKIFLAHFKLVKHKCERIDCSYYWVCEHVRRVINNITEEEISVFFDKLRDIYLYWINANIVESIRRFKELLREYDLLKFEKKIKDFDVYFKARVSDQVLTTWDMFHIPFNKRYLIQNQRFSLTGQPMLYIGSSVIDVAEEIEAKNIDEMKVSFIQISSDTLKIFDLRNNFGEIYDNIVVNEFLGKNNYNYDKAHFFKMILSSICSFQKRQELQGFSFCEEYVIPQILAQVLKTYEYNGIAYYSTKKYDKLKCFEQEDEKKGNPQDVWLDRMEYKENIAIFTELNIEHVYDKKLYETLTISVPIDIKKIDIISIDDLEEVKDEILKSGEQEKITFAEKIYSSFNRIYKDIKIGSESYWDTSYGKLHIYGLYTILNQVLVA